MDKYHILVTWSDEDGCFLAEIPELPGCIADGATEEEARQHAMESAKRWVKMAHYLGREVPIPVKADASLIVA